MSTSCAGTHKLFPSCTGYSIEGPLLERPWYHAELMFSRLYRRSRCWRVCLPSMIASKCLIALDGFHLFVGYSPLPNIGQRLCLIERQLPFTEHFPGHLIEGEHLATYGDRSFRIITRRLSSWHFCYCIRRKGHAARCSCWSVLRQLASQRWCFVHCVYLWGSLITFRNWTYGIAELLIFRVGKGKSIFWSFILQISKIWSSMFFSQFFFWFSIRQRTWLILRDPERLWISIKFQSFHYNWCIGVIKNIGQWELRKSINFSH